MTEQMTIEQAIEAGVQHHQAGRLEQAQVIYEQILMAHPEQPDALHLMGLLMLRSNRPKLAAELIARAITANPAIAQYHNSLGQAHSAAGAMDRAMQSYWLALALKPDFPEAFNSLGIALRISGKAEQAVECFNEALRLRPDYSDAWSNLGNALQMLGRWDQAVDSYRKALALSPNDPVAMSNLGNALQSAGRLDEAIESYRNAVEIRPNFASAWMNLGAALQNAHQFDQACQATEKALALNPDAAQAHHNLATLLLLQGEFEKGWEEFEWRAKLSADVRLTASLPQWDGGDLNGRRILLFPEQGFGDVIHFARYAPMIAERHHGKVVLISPPQLHRVLSTLRGVEAVVQNISEAPKADVESPLLSLGRLFKTGLQTIPAPIPYLSADPQLAEKWRERLAGHEGTKVGLVWAGRPEYVSDRTRSIPFKLLEPILSLPDMQFISLQKGPGAAELRESSWRGSVLDWTSELHDFADTAALIENLDLVIAVDTAVAHLAGAMGKPVWLLLSRVVDWRWLVDRDDSPWYPTLRLFRQQTYGDWQSLIQTVATELSSWRR